MSRQFTPPGPSGDESDMGHVVVESKIASSAAWLRPGAVAGVPLPAPLGPDVRTPRVVTVATAEPVVRCESCAKQVEATGGCRRYRCDCGRRLAVPSKVRVRCARCRFSHWVRVSELAVERACAGCGQTLVIPDVLLPRLRRRRPRLYSPRGASASHGNAVWTMLLIAASLLCVLLLFGRA